MRFIWPSFLCGSSVGLVVSCLLCNKQFTFHGFYRWRGESEDLPENRTEQNIGVRGYFLQTEKLGEQVYAAWIIGFFSHPSHRSFGRPKSTTTMLPMKPNRIKTRLRRGASNTPLQGRLRRGQSGGAACHGYCAGRAQSSARTHLYRLVIVLAPISPVCATLCAPLVADSPCLDPTNINYRCQTDDDGYT